MSAPRVMLTLPPAASTATVVIVPARNEARRISSAIDALRRSCRHIPSVHLVIVANNCVDDTASRAYQRCLAMNLSASILECDLSPTQGVGLARSIGFEHSLELLPEARYLLGTDADCQVDRDWIARNVEHLQWVDAVCGRVVPLPAEAHRLPECLHEPGALEHDYLQLVLHSEALLDPDPVNPWPHHGRASAASQAFTRIAYETVGGYAPVLCEEDRDIVSRLTSGGLSVRYADDVCVQASCRLRGRAPNGMADALSNRIANADSWADALLEPSQTHLLRVRARALCRQQIASGQSLDRIRQLLGLGPVPLAFSDSGADRAFGATWAAMEDASPMLRRQRLRPSALPRHIDVLSAVVRSHRGQRPMTVREAI